MLYMKAVVNECSINILFKKVNEGHPFVFQGVQKKYEGYLPYHRTGAGIMNMHLVNLKGSIVNAF